MKIEEESAEEYGYDQISYNLGESSVPDLSVKDFDSINGEEPLAYTQHGGNKELRNLIADQYQGVSMDQILVTNGASEALFVVAVATLNPDDHIVVEQPNYPSNYEVPRSLGCELDLLTLDFENNFKFNLDELRELMTSNTKIVSLTHPHNPTGLMISREELKEVVEIIEAHDCILILDETYRELVFDEKLPPVATLSRNAVSISSLSKSYGIPGIRVGWIAVKNEQLLNSFLAAKEQINICNSVLDERIAIKALSRSEAILKNNIEHLHNNFSLLENWLEQQSYLDYVLPEGGAVCFPRIKYDIDTDDFYDSLISNYKTFVGPGHWFEQSDKHFRIGFGWPSKENLKQGLNNISKALQTGAPKD